MMGSKHYSLQGLRQHGLSIIRIFTHAVKVPLWKQLWDKYILHGFYIDNFLLVYEFMDDR